MWVCHMFLCMRTTLDLDDTVLKAAKRRAVETRRTLTAVVEEALRELLRREVGSGEGFELRWKPVRGGAQAGVDLTDRDALLDRMEGRR